MNELTVTSPMQAILSAIDKGADLDKLEKAMMLQERWEASQAKRAYVEAMADFKAAPPKIEKLKKVSFNTSKGATSYSHATLADVTEKINAALSSHHLHAAWSTHQDAKQITVTCTITHIQGHSESTSLTAPTDESGSKNAIQAIGSTVTYLCRYTLLALTGLATYDIADDDGNSAGANLISQDQITEITDLLTEIYGDDHSRWLTWMKVESVEQIKAADYKKAINALTVAKSKKEGAK